MTKAKTARDAWAAMTALVLDRERLREVSDQAGLSFGKLKALRRIAVRPMPMGELGRPARRRSAQSTPVVDDLERAGLVERQAHPTDRRSKLVVATPAGVAVAQRAQEMLEQPPAGLRDLPAADLEHLLQILSRVSQVR